MAFTVRMVYIFVVKQGFSLLHCRGVIDVHIDVVNLLPVKDESILFYTICKTADIAYASILLIGFVMNVH